MSSLETRELSPLLYVLDEVTIDGADCPAIEAARRARKLGFQRVYLCSGKNAELLTGNVDTAPVEIETSIYRWEMPIFPGRLLDWGGMDVLRIITRSLFTEFKNCSFSHQDCEDFIAEAAEWEDVITTIREHILADLTCCEEKIAQTINIGRGRRLEREKIAKYLFDVLPVVDNKVTVRDCKYVSDLRTLCEEHKLTLDVV